MTRGLPRGRHEEGAGQRPDGAAGERILEVFERITDAFFGLDRAWRFTYLNPQAERLLSRSCYELVGRNVWEEFPEAKGSTFQREYERAARTGEKVSFEAYYPPLETWFEVNAYPSEEGLSVYFRDVTARKRAEEERERMREALLQSERRLRAVLSRYSSDVVMFLDSDGTIRHQSPAVERVLGYAPEALVGEEAFGYIHPDDQERTAATFSEVLAKPGPHGPVEYRFRHQDGSWRWMEALGNNLLSDPGVRAIVVNSRDVSERKRSEEELRRAEERFRSLVQNALDVITLVGADGTISYESPSVERVLGYKPEELIGTNILDHVHPEDVGRVRSSLAEGLNVVGTTGKKIECRFRHADGSWRHLEALGNNLLRDPSVGSIVINSRDVTERKELEERLEHQAFHDPLTGLPNRALLSERFEQAAGRADRAGKHLAILYLDLDGFKEVNDSLGHEAGDKLLVAVAGRLGAHSRLGDTVARLGGDEFCVLAEDVGGCEGAARVAGRVRGALREPFLVEGRRIPVSASIGRAVRAPGEDASLDRLLREADAAMYRAKKEKNGEAPDDPAG